MHIRDNLKAVQLSRKKLNVVESTLLHWRARLRSKPQPTGQPVTLRKRRENIKSEANWALFYYKLVKIIIFLNILFFNVTAFFVF